jgi:hypothetical protein
MGLQTRLVLPDSGGFISLTLLVSPEFAFVHRTETSVIAV